jgi:beta-glucosidase
MTTILSAITKRVGAGTKINYVKGCDIIGDKLNEIEAARKAAQQSKAAVVVLGESARPGPGATDGEGFDVASLDLTGLQEELVEAVYGTGTPTVVVLVNGRPLSTRWAAENVPAIVEAWRPGEKGGTAVAEVLFGDVNPSGRLPITIPRHVGQLPAYYNYKPSKATRMRRGYVDMPATPLYPFGHGLSYTSFAYNNLRVAPAEMHPSGEARVTLDVRNMGNRAGIETVQLYIHEVRTPVAMPVKQLRGFARVALNPGETRAVTFTLSPEDLQLLDLDLHWRVVPGDFEIMVGKSSADIALKGVLKVAP